MSRLAAFSVFLLFVIQAQGQMFSHGVPAGATSPQPDGRQNGIPASVLSPTPLPPGVHPIRTFNIRGPLRRFGNPRDHRRIVAVPVFYPIYGYVDPGYPADPYVQPSSDPVAAQADNAQAQQPAPDASSSDDALRQAYLQGARDALRDTLGQARVDDSRDSRYGEHYMDSRERSRAADQQKAASDRRDSDQPAAVPAAPKDDNSPATVFIFKDGHQIETRNFAIMGQTLYDFSGPVLKKVQLADVDKDATTKANDDRGLIVKLP